MENAAERGMTGVPAQDAARRASRRQTEQRPGVACRTESGKTDHKTDHAADDRDRIAQHTHHSQTDLFLVEPKPAKDLRP
jgi:ABC-type Zn2+ transport system substrate-binding protein/surface adhesin